MKDGTVAGEQTELSRQDLYKDYVNSFLRLSSGAGPCRDAPLLDAVTRYLLREAPGSTQTSSTVLPFTLAVREGCAAPGTDCRRLLTGFIKAAELLETLCVNLFLQPWKKEIHTLKTFTGPFVYCLLAVLSGSTIESLLASIGYLPHPDPQLSEYRLSKDASPDRAMLVGFELLLVRQECSRLLELLDRLEPQEWLDVLHRRAGGPARLEEPAKHRTSVGQEREEETGGKEFPPCSDVPMPPPPPVNPQPKPRRSRPPVAVDPSIVEMQMTYPDLAFRGRPLLPDKPQRPNGRRPRASDKDGDEGAAAEPPNRNSVKGTKAVCSEDDSTRFDDVFGVDGGGGCSCRDRIGVGGSSTGPEDDAASGNVSQRAENESGVDVEKRSRRSSRAPSERQTSRAGSGSAEPGDTRPTAEPPVSAQHQTAAELLNKRVSSVGSVDEEQELRHLAERMGQLHVQETDKSAFKYNNSTPEETNHHHHHHHHQREPALDATVARRATSPPQCDAAEGPAACGGEESVDGERPEQGYVML